MPSSSVPITDAFDAADPMESLDVALTPQQIAWLKDTAAERDLSLDHMLRTLINAQMRAEKSPSAAPPAASGDGRRLDGVPDLANGTAGSDGDDEATSGLSERVQAAGERVSSSHAGGSRSASTDEGPSMFDMMDE